MTNDEQFDLLCSELTAINDILNRRSIIFNDLQSGANRFKIIADTNPHLLFEILGGDEDEIELSNWAFEYSYSEYLENREEDDDLIEEKDWDMDEKVSRELRIQDIGM